MLITSIVQKLLTRGIAGFRFAGGKVDGFSVPISHLVGIETVIEAIIREAREEIGVSLSPSNVRVVQVMHRLKSDEERIDYFLTAAQWSGEVSNCEPEKCDLLEWFPVDELPSNSIPNVAYGIRYWREGVAFSTFGRSHQAMVG